MKIKNNFRKKIKLFLKGKKKPLILLKKEDL